MLDTCCLLLTIGSLTNESKTTNNMSYGQRKKTKNIRVFNQCCEPVHFLALMP